MSTIIMITLALMVIFWRPPFQLPRAPRKIVMPILVIIALGLFFIFTTFKTTSKTDVSQQTAKQINSFDSVLE